jgi:hypothetical protein
MPASDTAFIKAVATNRGTRSLTDGYSKSQKSKNTATRQFSESVPFSNRSIAILNKIGINSYSFSL